MEQRPFVIGVGELLWDVLPSGRRMGGAPVNFTYYAARGGCRALAVSALGRDASGDELLGEFRRIGLDDALVQRNGFPTGSVDVKVDSQGVPTYDIHENVAWDHIEADAATLEAVSKADAVCWGSLAQRGEVSRGSILTMVDAAPEEALRVFDINLRQDYYDPETVTASLRRADLFKLNEDELVTLSSFYALCGEAEVRLRRLCEMFRLRYVVYTEGAVGSTVVCGDGAVSRIPTPHVEVADTVGAGDSFTATFVAMLLQGHTLRESHARAVEVAAEVCTCHGAIMP